MKQLHPKAVWLFFLRGFGIWLALVIYFSITIFDIFVSTNGSIGFISNPLWWLGPIIFLVFIYLWSKLSYRFYRYELTDIVFKKEHGIIWKKYVSIPYDRIQNVDIYRGVFARLLGLSDIHVQTAGGITGGSYGAFSEGRLIGVSKEEAERLRDELIQRSRNSRQGQGL